MRKKLLEIRNAVDTCMIVAFVVTLIMTCAYWMIGYYGAALDGAVIVLMSSAAWLGMRCMFEIGRD